MLQKSITVIYDEISDYLRSTGKILAAPTAPDAVTIKIESPPRNNNNGGASSKKILISLINLEEEKVLKSQARHVKKNDDQISHVNPELRLTLYILIAADFPDADYEEGLGYLSDVIGFFQSKNVFTNENTPTIGTSIKKLVLDLHSLNFETQNHLWGVIGSNYLPSVVYRVQTIFIQEYRIEDIQKPVMEISLTGSSESA